MTVPLAALPHARHVRLAIACMGLLWLAGCAGPAGVFVSSRAPPAFRDQAMSMQNASDAIVTGQSTRARVLAALGPATVVRFDSGFEVWAYRGKTAKAAAPGAEFVVLFAPSGVVAKTRIRPPPDRPAE